MSQHGCPERLSNRSKGFQEDGAGQQTMEVLVETLTGTAFEMTVSPSDTVFAIKSKIFRVEGIPVSQQHLVYNLQELEDGASLGERGIGDGARLRLVLGMRGGPVATRRLAPPPPSDIDALLDSTREDGEWGDCGSGAWKVTVLVFRDGERVNMLRVRENHDGTYSPLDHNKYGSSLPHLVEGEAMGGAGPGAGGARPGAGGARPGAGGARPGAGGALADNALTLGKMIDLRRRMDSLAVQRRRPAHTHHGEKSEMQKTRSEETLPVGRMLDDTYYSCSRCDWLAERCLLPPIARDHPHQDTDRCKASRWPTPRLAARLAPVPTDYGGGWRGAVSLGSGGLLSSSTSALETLSLLPALSRTTNTEHLHLSDEGLHLTTTTAAPSPPATPAPAPAPAPAPTQAPTPAPAPAPARARCGLCRKRLSIATLHLCRCGGQYCAPHRYAEVHGCAYDYKADAGRYLQRANPLVQAPKLPKI